MLEPLRSDFNARFTPERYQQLRSRLQEVTRTPINFRVCETPCFFPGDLLAELASISVELTHQLLGNPEYLRLSEAQVPERYKVPRPGPHPHFMTADFGLARDEAGHLRPKLVEMQAFPSLLGFQAELSRAYLEVYRLRPDLRWLLGDLEESGYWDLARKTIVGDHDPENVVLAEVEPGLQKTLPDFRVHEDRLGIATVDIASLKRQGNRLLYERDGRWTPIERIYNRVIVEEMERRQVSLDFDYRDDLQVEWADSPNWFFQISKFSLPHLNHASVPGTVLLEDWFLGEGHSRLPESLDELLLKPLYSFAGRGIQFAPAREELEAIPPSERSLYLLQERVPFEPVIRTPEGPTQAEIRVMLLWPEGGELTPLVTLVRMGRGKMMGVDQNRSMEWVGGSASFYLK